jgi:two-component system, response regulator PhcR
MLEAALRRTDYAQSLVATFVHTARDAYHADGSATELASDLVQSVCDGYPLDSTEAGWLRCDLRKDFLLPGQRDLIYLVLCTLVKNALLALRSALPAQPLVRIEVQGGPESDMIRVCDNGPGIPAPLLQRLTREPVTTRADQGGSGMGLVLSQRVMGALGGRVTVESAPGAGTTVSLQFRVREKDKAHEVSP